MFACVTQSTKDPIVHGIAVRGAHVEVLVPGRGNFEATVTRIDVGRVWLSRGEHNLPSLARITGDSDRVTVAFRRQDSSPISFVGTQVVPSNIMAFRPGQPASWRTSAGCKWASMSLSSEDFARSSYALLGRELQPPEFHRLLSPPIRAASRLQRLHNATAVLAKAAPDVAAQPEALRGLEQSLIQAYVGCVAEAKDDWPDTGRRHAKILARFEAFLEANPDRPLYLHEVCETVGAPARTLRACCSEHLGMGPKHYLTLRRIHLARYALLETRPGMTTVTEVATRYGFWELGRFAVAYRSLFGELPSTTLDRDPEFSTRQEISSNPLGSAGLA